MNDILCCFCNAFHHADDTSACMKYLCEEDLLDRVEHL